MVSQNASALGSMVVRLAAHSLLKFLFSIRECAVFQKSRHGTAYRCSSRLASRPARWLVEMVLQGCS